VNRTSVSFAEAPATADAEDGCVPLSAIAAAGDLSLDPKRWCLKHVQLIAAVRAAPYLVLRDVIRPVVRKLDKMANGMYRYVEIDHIYEAIGAYSSEDYLGHRLPGRGTQVAQPGDLFLARIWSSAGKWMIAGGEARDGRLVVTSGCAQFEVIPGREAALADVVFGLCSEAFRVQMRARATGSDGLASVSIPDMLSIVVPRADCAQLRAVIGRRIKEMRRGQVVLTRLVTERLRSTRSTAYIAPRVSHVTQV